MRRDWGKITKKGKRYYADYQGPDGRRHTPGRSFPTKSEAEGWLHAERRLIDLDAWSAPKHRNTSGDQGFTVGEWIDHFHDLLGTQAHPLKDSTLQNYRRVVRTRITDTPLAGIPLGRLQTGDVYRWWDQVTKDHRDSPTTNQQAYKRLKAACGEAVRREMIPTNPVNVPDAGKRVDPEEKYLPSDGEIQAILDAIPDRYKAITSMILHHGVRIGEAIAVAADEVIIDNGRVTVQVRRNAQRITGDDGTYMLLQSTKTKAGVRDVPIMPHDAHYFIEHREKYPPVEAMVESDKGPIPFSPFTTTARGRMLMDSSYRNILARAEEKANVTTEINPHCGRNWLITRLAEEGAHLKEIGAILGQDDVSTILDVYMKVRAGRTVTVMDRVSNTLE